MCARDGSEQGISYDILQEVEKEVILVQSADGNADSGTPANNPEVLKTIRKLDVQLLCPQHNPVSFRAPFTGIPLTVPAGCDRGEEGPQTRQNSQRTPPSPPDVQDQSSSELWGLRSVTTAGDRRDSVCRGSVGQGGQEGVQVGRDSVR